MKKVTEVSIYHKGGLDANELDKNVTEIWKQLYTSEYFKKEVLDAQLTNDNDISLLASPYIFSIRGQGLSVAEVLVSVGVSVGSKAAYDFLQAIWLRYVYPILKERYDDALGEESEERKDENER